jgi:hypothetical protein
LPVSLTAMPWTNELPPDEPQDQPQEIQQQPTRAPVTVTMEDDRYRSTSELVNGGVQGCNADNVVSRLVRSNSVAAIGHNPSSSVVNLATWFRQPIRRRRVSDDTARRAKTGLFLMQAFIVVEPITWDLG